MGKQIYLQTCLDQKPVTFAIGGALIGLILFQTQIATIVGGLIGFAISFKE